MSQIGLRAPAELADIAGNCVVCRGSDLGGRSAALPASGARRPTIATLQRRLSHGADLRAVPVADEERPQVLSGRGKAAVLGAGYVYCFRAVGTIGREADLFTRSEIPVPVSSDAEWNTQPAEFDVLQHHVRRSTSSCTTWPTLTT
jgi:hypothetical protein